MRRLAILSGLLAATTAHAAPRLAPVWSDHIVVQRDAPIVVEGSSAPGEAISATLGDERQTATAGPDGKFALRFAARGASNAPLTLAVNGAAPVSDILVGDVWLCSGQSNMEMAVDRSLNSWSEINGSADAGLRLMQIQKDTAPVPRADFAAPAPWKLANPQSVAPFSAACFVMARELRRKLGVPIGAIHSSWGGSQIRAWLSPGAGAVLYGAADMAMLTRYESDPLGAVTAFAPRWEDWYRAKSDGSQPWRQPDSLSWNAVPAMTPWNNWTGTPLATQANGTVWLRRTITLTAAQAKAGGTLSIGLIDDVDMTWVNGKPVGNTFSWDAERNYRVPASYLKRGANEIVFAATNSWGNGGFSSSADRLAFSVTGGERIALGEGWRYAIAPVREFPPRAPWDSNAGIGVMHNRMVAPLGAIALKGAAWYQGESDVGIPGYRDRMRELFAGWRRQFGPQMRMLVVQLANFGPPQIAPAYSGWAALREDQRQSVLADGNASLVTAIDLGERTDIHPANKVELGRRLARAAEGGNLPQPVSAAREGDSIRVRFSGVDGGLSAWSSPAPLGFELCGSDQASCRYAAARIDGDSVMLAGDGKAASRVRYGWGDSPLVNLFDAQPLPVPGFELTVTP